MTRLSSFRVALGLAVGALAGGALAATVEVRQTNLVHNIQSYQGVPISRTVGVPPGSDGRVPDPQDPNQVTLTANAPTPGQFQTFLPFGGLAAPRVPGQLADTLSYVANAQNIQLPVGLAGDGSVAVVLRSAEVGAPYQSRQISFLFGSVIPVPDADADGQLFTQGESSTDYWLAEPYTTVGHTNAPYYWSPHRRTVFAIQPGPIAIVWKKAAPEASQPPGLQNVDWVQESGFYYRLFTGRYVVSGSAVKKPRTIYWTQGDFRVVGKPVTVPSARIGGVSIVFNNSFPERVDHEYVSPGQIPIVEEGRLEETRTLWYDQPQGQILAYNVEGRVFVELLGDLREDGNSRLHLGFEIVDVFKQPSPDDVVIELGERLTAWQDGRDDAHLVPEQVMQVGAPTFLYRQTIGASGLSRYYATRETQNLNDVLVHWLEQGEVGLRWPFRLVRYEQVWPADAAKYSHYVRPAAADETEASATAVPLPLANAPVIEYQDSLDQPRAYLSGLDFFTFLEPAYPAHRTLLRLSAGSQVAFERVFSWLDGNLKSGSFGGTVATNLSAWNPGAQTLSFPDEFVGPRLYDAVAPVGARIDPPPGELGESGGEMYWAGHLRVDQGTSFNPQAYLDPFEVGFEAANQGAIIPVNVLPGNDRLEIHWFRRNAADRGRGFEFTYWPAVIGRYTLIWPADPAEIILASNDGSGGLVSLQAKGRIYYQNDRSLPGYNPNEEHALMLGGQAFALRDDLNLTTGPNYSSEPFVLLEYLEADNRPAMRPFRVRREKPEAGILFDYITEAGTKLQAPMPLPLLPKPVEGAGPSAINYNTEPLATNGDLPGGWNDQHHNTDALRHYRKFVYRDRKEDFWVYRSMHAGLPPLQAGTFDPFARVFEHPAPATAIAEQDFTYVLHASRLAGSLLITPKPSTPLPAWLRINGVTLTGRPAVADVGTVQLTLVITAVDDEVTIERDLTIEVAASGSLVTQGPSEIESANDYVGAPVTYVGRPPYLADSPAPTNSFTMRFYYRTEEGFAFPELASAPAVGTIVPYLRPKNGAGGFVGQPADKLTLAQDIVYRPVWPYAEGRLGKMRLGDTLMTAKLGLPSVREQTSLKLLYQQSIAADLPTARVSAILHDATREKFYDITRQNLEALPPGIHTDAYLGKLYFPNLPPHLARRLFFDPNRGAKGHLVLRGEYVEELLGEKYVLLNVLRGSDLAAVKAVCPPGEGKTEWDNIVEGLSTKLETFRENPAVPGTFIPEPLLDQPVGVGALAEIGDDDTAVDSYALSASGPGQGYLTLIAGNGWAFTPSAEPVSMYVIKVGAPLYRGELKVIAADNPLNEQLTMQHTADLAGRFAEYEYEWMISPPVDGLPPAITPGMELWTSLASGLDLPRFTLGGAGIQALSDNYVVMRYRPVHPAHPLVNQWSAWTEPQLAEGWIKRVLAGINPFNQRVNDLFNNRVNTDASILTQAGRRWEGDIALNLENINRFGLIEIYETVLRRGRMLSIDAGINYGPANDALLLVSGYLNDLYLMMGNEAWADAANPTIGIGTKDQTYGDIATSSFSFQGQVSSLLEEELALLRGRDDFLQPGVEVTPVYNRLVWNYTRGIDAGEVIYALNYNIQEDNDDGFDGVINAEDALKMFPQGHGDAYGHYLTALQGYYALLLDADFDWVPRTEAVLVLGKPVQVDYLDERKFASAAAAVSRTGRQIFDLTWKRDYQANQDGWEHFSEERTNTRRALPSTRRWGLDHWAARTGQGAYLHWVVGNAILPDLDPDPNHEGIQVIDRTTVPELTELTTLARDLQTAMDNAEGRLSPLGLPEGSLAFDINPSRVTGADPATHFEQIYERAQGALNNAVASFDDAKDVTRLMRSEQDSLVDLQARINQQEVAYENALIEIYGTPYPDDIGPGRTYKQGYTGPDLFHFTYVETPEIVFPELWNHTEATTFNLDLSDVPSDWTGTLYQDFEFITKTDDTDNYEAFLTYNLGPHGFFDKPTAWTGQRTSPGQVQQAISEFIAAHRRLKQALYDSYGGKADLDKAIRLFESKKNLLEQIRDLAADNLDLEKDVADLQATYDVLSKDLQTSIAVADMIKDVAVQDLPDSSIFGLANGGDLAFAVRSVIGLLYVGSKLGLLTADAASHRVLQNKLKDKREDILDKTKDIADAQLQQDLEEGVYALFKELEDVQAALETISVRLREFEDAERGIRTLTAQGNRIQAERETFRRRSAAIIQGFRTRDAAFRIFRNEKLERYKALFDLAARYTFLAANAYDYETGLLHTQAGQDFVNRILRSRALGVVRQGEPQFAGSNTGDPGLSSALAEMKADWQVLKGRLGFNNPDAYGTTVSLRTENLRIFPGTEGHETWQDTLHRARRANLLDDGDVVRSCLQIGRGDGLPVPGLVLEFHTTIADGLNLFGQMLAAGDHAFSPSSFATKIYAAGIAFEGYLGMDVPSANTSAIDFGGGQSPHDPTLSFLDPDALAATPYIYLIPVGADSMRSPPLGDASQIRTWQVQDITVPLPFNLGASDFSTRALWQSSASLTEDLFSVRKHQAFRPVDRASYFSQDLYGANGQLAPSQFTNRRLVGRSVWNSKWKLVIPGHTLLNDPNEGLDRFLRTVKDIKLHFVTYSYSGN